MNTQKRLIPKGQWGLFFRALKNGAKKGAKKVALGNVDEATEKILRQKAKNAGSYLITADDVVRVGNRATSAADNAAAAADDVVSNAATSAPKRKPRTPRKPKETPAQPQNTSNTPAWLWRTAENSPEWNKWGRYAWNTGVGLSAADIALNGIKGVRAGLDENTEYTPVYAGPPSWTIGVIGAATAPSKQQEQPEKASSRIWIPE